MISQQQHQQLRRRAIWVSLGWGMAGLALLLTSPLVCWTPQLGWSPLFWLVLAPASVLLSCGMTRARGKVAARAVRRTDSSVQRWRVARASQAQLPI